MTRGRYRWALAVVAVSAFMIAMDNTVVAIAQETIRRDLGMGYAALRWVTIGYVLMFSCLLIAGGRLADLYGCRITFTVGMAVFTGASAVCGLADSGAMLIAARLVQGVGSAVALPAVLVVITVGRTDRQRSIGQLVWLVSLSLALAGGPGIGGFIVEHRHWGWIFLVNVPAGLAVIALGLVALDGPAAETRARVDLPGVLVSATALFALVYAFHAGGELGWTDPEVLGVAALAVVAGICFVIVEGWAPDPMIDMAFFRNRVFTGGIVTSMLWGIGFNGVMYYSALFMQNVLAFTPTTAAVAYLPTAALVLVTAPVSFLVAARFGARLGVGLGMVLMAAGMATFTLLRQGDGFAQLLPGIALISIGSALTMPLGMYALKAVPDERAGVAGGIINVVRELSAGIGIAVLGLVVDTLESRATASGAGRAEAFRQGTSVGLLVGAALVLVGAVVAAFTMPTRRQAAASDAAKEKAQKAAAREEPEPVAVGASAYTGQGPQRTTAELWPPVPPPGYYLPYLPEDGPPPDDGGRPRRFRGDPW
ncbi:MFS transporter [Thermomonospora umbrina]|uniref:EmrB/QacA subfamily drug resistance transporter n=1 Tax=Thermomonospora umbrina TaxID=111806 RepID=A0A3D9SNW5_9ACTN|nr:MFS transporter [Thermomonospora umbrina]REE97588.1 EmrB/QacA subfamily drug resistance transporter [Thermomonospora umbrina]